MTSRGKKLLGLAGSNLKQISSGSPKTPLRNISNVLPPTPKTSKYDAGTMKSFLEDVKTNAELRKEALEKEEEENVNNNTFMLDEEMQEELHQGRQQEVEKELKQSTSTIRNVECTPSGHLNFGIGFGTFVGNVGCLGKGSKRKKMEDH